MEDKTQRLEKLLSSPMTEETRACILLEYQSEMLMQTCNMDERTNEEKLLHSIAMQKDRIYKLNRSLLLVSRCLDNISNETIRGKDNYINTILKEAYDLIEDQPI